MNTKLVIEKIVGAKIILLVIIWRLIPTVKLSILTDKPKSTRPISVIFISSFSLDIISSRPMINKIKEAIKLSVFFFSKL